MKKALILNTSHNDLGMIHALKSMGFYVIAIGGTPGLIGQKYVDEYHQMDYSQKEKVCEFAKQLGIDAICSCCNDLGVITASYVAEKLGLPGHDTYENTLIMHHKDRFKEFAIKNGIQTPHSKYFTDIDEAYSYCLNAEYPLIVKPTDLSAGRGVSFIQNTEMALDALKNAFEKSRIKHIVIEPYIDGSQHALCTFIKNKKVVAFCSNNEYSFTNPYRVEIDTYPSSNYNEVKDFLIAQAEKMTSLLDLKDGILSMQYRMKDGKPYIIEAMRRVLGNLYMIPANKLTNMDWDYWEARTHCGLDIDEFPKNVEQKGVWAYRTIMASKNGEVKELVIPEKFKKYIFDEYRIWEPGYVVKDYMNEPLSFLFMKFDSKNEMEEIVINGYNEIFAI